MRNDVVVIGIDPGMSESSGKKTIICCDIDGGKPVFKEVIHQCINDKINSIIEEAGNKKVLITWDAPLTGPACLHGAKNWNMNFTERMIENYFKNKNLPEGISIRGYGGCPHWTISRYVLNLPQMSEHDCKPRFKLAPFNNDKIIHSLPDFNGTMVVEVHPALALWVWLKDTIDKKYFTYKKGKKEDKKEAMLKIIECLGETKLYQPNQEDIIKSDDHFDAWLAYLLGYLWVQDDITVCGKKVALLGNIVTGAMLLPKNQLYAAELAEVYKNSMPETPC